MIEEIVLTDACFHGKGRTCFRVMKLRLVFY